MQIKYQISKIKNLEQDRLPKIKLPSNMEEYEKLQRILREENLNTVCQEANCPNMFNCFSRGTLTFMILGNVCTRNCSYCNVKTGEPITPDVNEPKRIANFIERLGLKYVVITSVTRDDLDDGGASVFAETVRNIRDASPECKVELLISDLKGNGNALETIVDANPQIIGHNMEVVRKLFRKMRHGGDYERSMELLKNLKKYDAELTTKSGFMVGLGETRKEIIQTMKDIKSASCDIITIGQYLAPSTNHVPVSKFYSTEEFSFFKEAGESLGFKCIESGPLVRSSFNASTSYEKARRKICGIS